MCLSVKFVHWKLCSISSLLLITVPEITIRFHSEDRTKTMEIAKPYMNKQATANFSGQAKNLVAFNHTNLLVRWHSYGNNCKG